MKNELADHIDATFHTTYSIAFQENPGRVIYGPVYIEPLVQRVAGFLEEIYGDKLIVSRHQRYSKKLDNDFEPLVFMGAVAAELAHLVSTWKVFPEYVAQEVNREPRPNVTKIR